jgi:GT2 family glycosyltransferase
VSAIVANWNGESDLRVCLPSLAEQTYSNLEVVVVDGGSTDGSEVVVRQWNARWIDLGRNQGLAAALNAGARVAQGEYLLFLNNDMRFRRDFVERLLAGLLSEDRALAADAMQYDWTGSNIVHACTRLEKGEWPRGEIPGWSLCQSAVANISECVMGSAANLLVRRKMFEALQGWDERYLVGWEDLDLCWRARIRGWRTVYVPQAVCWHRVGASAESRDGSLARLGGTVSGRLLFATKLLPIRQALTVWALSCMGLTRSLLFRSPRETAARLSSLGRLARSMPEVLAERKRLSKSRAESPLPGKSPRPVSTHPLDAT